MTGEVFKEVETHMKHALDHLRRRPQPEVPAAHDADVGLDGPGQRRACRLVASGQSVKQIARTLGIAPKTADNHLQNLYAKIGVKTRGGATLFALEHGLGAVTQK